MLLSVFLLTALTAEPSSPLVGTNPSCSPELFRIERSKNANVVLYESTSNPREPVSASWLLLATTGAREALTLFERAFAYGFDVKHGELTLKAFKDRSIRLDTRDGCPVALSVIDGHAAVLRRIYVKATEGLAPSVEYVELFGVDTATGASLMEKVVAR